MNLVVSCLFFLSWSLQYINAFESGGSKRKTNILNHPECAKVKQLCGNLSEDDDVLVLECLQSLHPSTLSKLHEDCQHVVWQRMRSLIENDNVNEILQPVCRGDLLRSGCEVSGQPGTYLKCIVAHKDDVENVDCAGLIERIENIAFYDYKWIASFFQHCTGEITRLKCGRIDYDRFSQLETLACLQGHLSEVPETCRKEVHDFNYTQFVSVGTN